MQVTSDVIESKSLKECSRENPPTQLNDRYVICNQIGVGPSGIVYKGFDKKYKKDVAIKIYNSDVTFDAKSLEIFQSAIKVQNKIKNEELIKTHEVLKIKSFTISDETYTNCYSLVMDYVPEVTPLSDFIDKELTTTTIHKIFTSLLETLQCLHERKIVHRAVFPSNILVDKNFNVYLGGLSPSSYIKEKEYITQNREYKRAQYIPPEYYNLRTTHFEADLYSVAIILLELLTGENRNDSVVATENLKYLAKVNHAAPDWLLTSINNDRFKHIIKTGLREQKERRYKNAYKMMRDFKQEENYYLELGKFLSGVVTMDHYRNNYYRPSMSEAIIIAKKTNPKLLFLGVMTCSFLLLTVSLYIRNLFI